MYKFYGHNCFKFSGIDSILLTDPWFSEKGAFFGSWFQYPKNHHLKEEVLQELKKRSNNIFISHGHQDHFDLEFLKLVPKTTNIIIPSYRDKSLKTAIENISLRVIELEDKESFIIDKDLKVTLFISEIGINHDAAILIETDKYNFFNQNDCKIFDRLSEINVDIDFYSVQFSGATWHPSNYTYSQKRKEIIAEKKVLNKFQNVLHGIEILNPKFFIPAAGPAIFPFLDASLSLGNRNIFVHQSRLHDFLNDNGFKNTIYLKPGQYFDEKYVSPIPPPNKYEINKYIENLSNPWDEIGIDFDKDSLINEILIRLKEIEEFDIKNSPIIIFNINEEEKIFIDLNKKEILDNFNYNKPYQEIFAEKKYFALMHSDFSWQDIYLSLRAKVTRKPDVFSNFSNIFLFSDPYNIKDSFMETLKIKEERIVIKVGNKSFEINRFCPHQGSDLCNAKVEGLFLKCPRHGWAFDLSNKGINIESGESIKSVEKA